VLTDAQGANNSEIAPIGSRVDHDFVLHAHWKNGFFCHSPSVANAGGGCRGLPGKGNLARRDPSRERVHVPGPAKVASK